MVDVVGLEREQCFVKGIWTSWAATEKKVRLESEHGPSKAIEEQCVLGSPAGT